MTVKPEYFYVGKAPAKVSAENNSLREKTKTNGDLLNPLFNFEKSFTDDFSKITQLELAQAIPYIKLDIVDFSGKSVNNLNVSFFHKQIDFNAISQEERYSDRPTLSLQNIDISISEASGYICYTDVTLRIKIHKKNDLSNKAVLGLLFPGCLLRLEYGWNSSNDFLGQRQVLSMSVISYTMNLDKTGQADLVVTCKAFNSALSAVLIGDLGPEDGNGYLSISYTQIDKFLKYAKALESNKDVNDYSLISASVKKYENRAKVVKGKISTNFLASVTKLHDKKFRAKSKLNNKPGAKEVRFLTFHDIFYILCDDTLKAITKTIPIETFEIVYGTFNKSSGKKLSNTSVADLLINYDKFMGFIKEKRVQGATCITISELLTELISYAEDEVYVVEEADSKSKDKEKISWPKLIANFSNSGTKLTLSIFDIKANLPITTNEMPTGKSSSGAVERTFTKDFNLPLMALGNANTFIKEISLSRVDDPQMEAVMISRAAAAAYQNPRDPVINGDYINTGPVNPLTLPLQGSSTMIGHVGWLPQRAFYLSTGLFMVDAVYIISSVQHSLSRDRI